MRHLAFASAFAVLLASSSVHAGSVCIQNDSTADVLVLLKSSFKRGKGGAAGGYLADFVSANFYQVRPITVGMVTSTGGYVGIGFTEYAPTIGTNASLNSNLTNFHHIACTLGADNKISVLDVCRDIVTPLGGTTGPSQPMHVIECTPGLRIP
jgi:hypothetical protein